MVLICAGIRILTVYFGFIIHKIIFHALLIVKRNKGKWLRRLLARKCTLRAFTAGLHDSFHRSRKATNRVVNIWYSLIVMNFGHRVAGGVGSGWSKQLCGVVSSCGYRFLLTKCWCSIKIPQRTTKDDRFLRELTL